MSVRVGVSERVKKMVNISFMCKCSHSFLFVHRCMNSGAVDVGHIKESPPKTWFLLKESYVQTESQGTKSLTWQK